MFRVLKKLFRRPPHRRMLELAAGVTWRHEVKLWTKEEHGQRATPPHYYTPQSWMGYHFIQYYCEDCDGPLTAGPSGYGSTNSVCETCKLNYGTLPLSLER